MIRNPLRPRLGGVLAALLVASGVLTACSDDGDGDATPEADVAQAETSDLIPAAEGNVEYPLTLETSWGAVTIEERPERIVAGDGYEYSLLAALGVTPIGVQDRKWTYNDAVPWAMDLIDDDMIENSWEWGDLTYPHEPIAKAAPDLIVATTAGPDPVPNLDQLSTIAPVLAPPVSDEEYPAWPERLALLAESLDLTERAEQVQAEYDEFFATIQEEHPEFAGQTVSVIGWWGPDDIYLMNTTDSDWDNIFRSMGFVENPSHEPFGDEGTMSAELVGDVSADAVILIDLSETPDQFAEWVESPVVQGIDGIQDGNLVVVENADRKVLRQDGEEVAVIGHIGMAVSDPLGTQGLAAAFEPLLAEAMTD